MTTEVSATLRVIGSASCGAPPDRVQIQLAAEHSAVTAPEALDGASTAAKALVSSVRTGGVADHEIQTSGMSLDREWDHQKNQESGYVARLRYTVTAPVDGAGELIASAADAAGDAIRIESVNLSLHDQGSLRERAQRDAFDDARTQAGELARLAGRQLGPVLLVDASPTSGPMPLQPRMAMVLESGSSGRAFPGFEGGEFSVSATVVVVYQLV